MPKCKSCGAPIKFIKLPSGKLTPVEEKETNLYNQEAGNWYLYKGHEPHWPNCENADKHRRRKTKTQELARLTKREGGP